MRPQLSLGLLLRFLHLVLIRAGRGVNRARADSYTALLLVGILVDQANHAERRSSFLSGVLGPHRMLLMQHNVWRLEHLVRSRFGFMLDRAIDIAIALLAHSVDRRRIGLQAVSVLLLLLDLYPLLDRRPDPTRDSLMLAVVGKHRRAIVPIRTDIFMSLPGRRTCL